MAYEVTIGIPVYNVEKYIRSSLDSALAQTFESIEFLILDDCGTDQSIDIVKEYQQIHPRGKDIRIVRQPHNMGIGETRNRIIDETNSTYLYLLDADDDITPNTIELLYKNAKEYDADIVYGSYERVELLDGQMKRTEFRYPSTVFLKENDFSDYVYTKFDNLQATTWNFLVKIDVIKKNNLRFNSINYWEDFTFTMDLPTYITRAVLLRDITYFYYCRYGSLSNFQVRSHIDKSEILATVRVMNDVKAKSDRLRHMPYFHKRMMKVMKTLLYMACTIIKDEKVISPSFSDREIRDIMRSPLSLYDILKMRGWRLRNLTLYLLGMLPPAVSVSLIRRFGIKKGII